MRLKTTKAMTKRIILLISAILFMAGVTSYAITRGKAQESIEESPSPYSELLPDSYRTAILSADSIYWMLIDGWTPSDSTNNVPGKPIGEILDKRLSNDSVLNENIKDLLLTPTSFSNDSMVKECTFIPDFGIMFVSGSDSLVMSYSTYCDMCRFQTKNDFWDYDGTLLRDSLFSMLKKEFPRDKYIRNITRHL